MRERHRQYGTIDEFRTFVNADTVIPRSNVHQAHFEAGDAETMIQPAVGWEPEVIPGDNTADYHDVAKRIVHHHVMSGFEEGYQPQVGVYVVWFCKILQHWKALVGTTLKDDRYLEVTFNGDKNEVYVDDYTKRDNTTYTLGA